MDLSASVLLLFIVAAFVAFLARRIRVPYTVALVLAGLLLGATRIEVPLQLTKELLFTVFLPGLLFDAAFRLELDEFWRNRVTIFSLALPGVVLATLISVAALVPGLHWAGADGMLTWQTALIFAALISATDPIAVVAVVRKLGAPPRLGLLIEGESLLNDGTAAVFFTLAVAMVSGTALGTVSIATEVVYMIGGGIIVGGVIGLVAATMLGRLDDTLLEITLTTIVAYGAFLVGERLHTSGVIATVTAGLLCGNERTHHRVSPSVRVAVFGFWEYVSFALNSLVFLLIGIQVRIPALLDAWRPILVAYFTVTVGRALVTYGLAAILPKRERLPYRWVAVLTWSGLRGGLAMVLALSLPLSLPQRDFIITLTYGVVILSIVLQGSTVSPLLRWLGMGRSQLQRDEFETARGELMASRAALEELEHLSSMQLAGQPFRDALEQEYQVRIADAEERLRALHAESPELPAEELDRARRHLLNVERDYVLDAFRLGAVSEAVRDRLLADVDARWARSGFGAVVTETDNGVTPDLDEADSA